MKQEIGPIIPNHITGVQAERLYIGPKQMLFLDWVTVCISIQLSSFASAIIHYAWVKFACMLKITAGKDDLG